jgi:hypothetical protein
MSLNDDNLHYIVEAKKQEVALYVETLSNPPESHTQIGLDPESNEKRAHLKRLLQVGFEAIPYHVVSNRSKTYTYIRLFMIDFSMLKYNCPLSKENLPI